MAKKTIRSRIDALEARLKRKDRTFHLNRLSRADRALYLDLEQRKGGLTEEEERDLAMLHLYGCGLTWADIVVLAEQADRSHMKSNETTNHRPPL